MANLPHPLPSLFVPHGSPVSALRPGPSGEVLAQAARTLPQPRVIVIVSAHWDTAEPMVGFAERPATIHDFYGFPEPLYRLRYPATGCPEAAREVVEALRSGGLPVHIDSARGLDHGAWIPLRTMFPEADIPVVPLSIQSHAGPRHAWRLGTALAPLAERGFLVIASGNLTHNLGDFRSGMHEAGSTDYVRRFTDWIAARLAEGGLEALLDYRRRAPDAVRAHPTDEHLLPLFVALGAAGPAARANRLHAGIDYGVLAMDAYAFTPEHAT